MAKNKISISLKLSEPGTPPSLSDKLRKILVETGAIPMAPAYMLEKGRGGLREMTLGGPREVQRLTARNSQHSGFFISARSVIQTWGLIDFTGPEPVVVPPSHEGRRVNIPMSARDWAERGE